MCVSYDRSYPDTCLLWPPVIDRSTGILNIAGIPLMHGVFRMPKTMGLPIHQEGLPFPSSQAQFLGEVGRLASEYV